MWWIARDFTRKIYLYKEKPEKAEHYWCASQGSYIEISQRYLPNNINPKWEDKEPIQVDLKILKAFVKKSKNKCG